MKYLNINTIQSHTIFLLINIITFLLYNQNEDYTIIKHTLWITSNFVYFISLNNAFKENYDSGIIEQLIISTKNFRLFLLKELVCYWLKVGFGLILLANFMLFILNSQTLREMFLFNLSLIYSTLSITIISMIGNSLSANNYNNIIAMIINIPLILPILIAAKMLSSINNIYQLITILMINTITIVTTSFLLDWIIRMNVQEN